jgi:4-hydroxy-3-polyprenylbenzoate decarboxylase
LVKSNIINQKSEIKTMSLQDFIEILRQKDELIEINSYVNLELEVTEIVDRISKSNDFNKAILFTNNGTEFPLLINAFGNETRISLALHQSCMTDVEKKIESLFSMLTPPKSFMDKLSVLRKIASMGKLLPKVISRKGKCQQVIHLNPDLNMLPILKCWTFDGGKFITLPMVHTKDVYTGKRNVGMYRMQVFSDTTTGMHWHIHKTGAMHYEEAKKSGKKIPIAVTLGGDPVYTYCASAPLPEGMDEYLLAGFLRNKHVKLVKCLTQDIEVPEDCDIVLEGYVDTTEPLHLEGPFGDHTGFYSLPDRYPVFHVTAITHRENAVYPTTIVGIPPQEDYWFIKASERIFFPLLKKTLLPEILDMRMPSWGVAHNLVMVQIEPRYPQHASKVAHALWGNGQMMLNKILIITNQPLTDLSGLFEMMALLPYWKKRMVISFGPMDVLEHAGIKPIEGGKLFFDAVLNETDTKLAQQEINTADLTKCVELAFSPSACNSVFALFGIFILSVDANFKVNTDTLKNVFQQTSFPINEIRIIFVDKSLQMDEMPLLMWHFLANFDPSVDFNIISIGNQLDILLFNGAVKSRNGRVIPNPVISTQETIDKIDSMWSEIMKIPLISSPSLRVKKLLYGEKFIADI